MGLDAIYGEGSSERFAKAVPRDGVVEEIDLPDGTARVNVRWENGSRMKLHVRGEEVSFLDLRSEGRGLYGALVNAMLDTFREFGVRRFVAMPRGPEAKQALQTQGDWKPTQAGGLKWEIS
jgi:hypothetical protein